MTEHAGRHGAVIPPEGTAGSGRLPAEPVVVGPYVPKHVRIFAELIRTGCAVASTCFAGLACAHFLGLI